MSTTSTRGAGTTYHLPRLEHPLVPFVLLCCAIHDEIPAAVLVYRQNGRHVTTPVAVVRGRPYCDELLVEHVLVAFLHELVRACDELQLVDVVELHLRG